MRGIGFLVLLAFGGLMSFGCRNVEDFKVEYRPFASERLIGSSKLMLGQENVTSKFVTYRSELRARVSAVSEITCQYDAEKFTLQVVEEGREVSIDRSGCVFDGQSGRMMVKADVLRLRAFLDRVIPGSEFWRRGEFEMQSGVRLTGRELAAMKIVMDDLVRMAPKGKRDLSHYSFSISDATQHANFARLFFARNVVAVYVEPAWAPTPEDSLRVGSSENALAENYEALVDVDGGRVLARFAQQ
ncbi:hypothetical protein CCB80_15190 [Armatimonadetes bacterium Uphvl-Ar1]|nr:hypothetical protein CCB80_15190 [Armatimonadetes bacterium Uphvl-Ar1]